MPKHSETRILPYTPRQLYDLVIDVERYPEFLPWCQSVIIHERKRNAITADLVIGYRSFNEKFTSQVNFKTAQEIQVEYGGGPLTHLSNHWKFSSAPEDQCEISFFVDFDFRSPLLSALMGAFFDQAFNKMVGAFEARAADLYG
jgi:coenzyme Q-binding protein COQ10